jgi:hypothetical protein
VPDHNDEVEETITFANEAISTVPAPATMKPASETTVGLFDQGNAKTNEMRSESDYEMIDDKVSLETSVQNAAKSNELTLPIPDDDNYELDELEAEIARELED